MYKIYTHTHIYVYIYIYIYIYCDNTVIILIYYSISIHTC